MSLTALEKVQKKAKSLGGISTVMLSDRKNKRFKALLARNNKWVHFGQPGEHAFVDHGDRKRRTAYRRRAEGIKNKQGQKTYLIPETANYLAYNLLW